MLFCDRLCVRKHDMGEGIDGSCLPLPIRPQRHWDPASPVILLPVLFQFIQRPYQQLLSSRASSAGCGRSFSSFECLVNFVDSFITVLARVGQVRVVHVSVVVIIVFILRESVGFVNQESRRRLHGRRRTAADESSTTNRQRSSY